jgi:hypothetical protein
VVRWAALVVVLFGVVVSPAGASTLGKGELLALGVQRGVPYAVVERESSSKPFTLVHGGRNTPFGIDGAEDPDFGLDADGGLAIVFDRGVSSGLEFDTAPADAPSQTTYAGRGTAAPKLDDGNLAYPDELGNAVDGATTLTGDAPLHRHLPLDAQDHVVLDLDQQRTDTQLKLLGPNAPVAPALHVDRLQDIDAALAIADEHAYVALAVNGRVLLATAPLQPQAEWTVTRIAAGTTGAPAIARVNGTTHVAYERKGTIYVDRRRLALGSDPRLADDGTRVFAGWTHENTALLARIR